MLKITLPDNSIKSFEQNEITILDISKSISKSLEKITVCGKVNDVLVDSYFTIKKDSKVQIITNKDKEGLEVLRHSTAHLLAQSVKELYKNEVQVVIGPTIENGFYYDFSFKRTFSIKDLEEISKKMNEIIKRNLKIEKIKISKDDAISYFQRIGENYKVKIIEEIPNNETLSLYKQGDFIDLCRGPHLTNFKFIKAVKILKTSGAYFKGDSKNEMLQRIYGTSFFSKKELQEYLNFLEEAEKRDHRKIGKTLSLFHFQEESPGIPFFFFFGVKIWRVIEDYIRESNIKYGCFEIKTPLIADISLWNKSGHSDKYAENMFITKSENKEYAIRPMNCPTSVQIYNSSLHSYRDLPLRMAEFGIVHRNEPSGSLHGLLRVRSFTQDDGHIFCTENQIENEVVNMIEQCFEVYKDFGFNNFDVKLALRPLKRIGSNEIWDNAEEKLKNALIKKNINFENLEGEGAFYGPKIEFHLKDSIGRSWQCGTIQLDFSMPERLNAFYIDENNQRKTVIMIHRAILGSFERFIGMLIEHYAGKLPLWLAPNQIALMGVSNNQDSYIKDIAKELQKSGFKCKIDLRNQKLGFKIREHTLMKIPYLIIIGEKEQNEKLISVRQGNKNLAQMSLYSFINTLKLSIENKD